MKYCQINSNRCNGSNPKSIIKVISWICRYPCEKKILNSRLSAREFNYFIYLFIKNKNSIKQKQNGDKLASSCRLASRKVPYSCRRKCFRNPPNLQITKKWKLKNPPLQKIFKVFFSFFSFFKIINGGGGKMIYI